MADEKKTAKSESKGEVRATTHDVKTLGEVPAVEDIKIDRCAHCARALVAGNAGCAFEWTAKNGAALDAKHEGQFKNFGDVGAWVLNGWAVLDAGNPDAKTWILTDKGRALTEAEFDAGVAAFFGLTFR